MKIQKIFGLVAFVAMAGLEVYAKAVGAASVASPA